MLPTAISPSQLRQGFQQRTAMPSRLRVRLSRHRHPSLYREQILSARKEGRMKIELEKPPEQRAAFQRRMQCQTRQLPWQLPARLQLAHFLLRESFLRFQPHTNSARLTQSPRLDFTLFAVRYLAPGPEGTISVPPDIDSRVLISCAGMHVISY